MLSLLLAWSFFHKLYEPESELARNFLVIAPNIIVLDRIYKDFAGLRIFFEDPVLPDNGTNSHDWRNDFQLTLHVQDDVHITHPTGNIFLTNIHRVYAGADDVPTANNDDLMDYFLGPRPVAATTDSKVNLGVIVRDVNWWCSTTKPTAFTADPRMAWFKSIEDIHNRLKQKGASLSLQVDVTATPKHNDTAQSSSRRWPTIRWWRRSRRMWSSTRCCPTRPAGPSWSSARAPNSPRSTPTISTWGSSNGARLTNSTRSWARRLSCS